MQRLILAFIDGDVSQAVPVRTRLVFVSCFSRGYTREREPRRANSGNIVFFSVRGVIASCNRCVLCIAVTRALHASPQNLRSDGGGGGLVMLLARPGARGRVLSPPPPYILYISWDGVGWQPHGKTCRLLLELDNQGTVFFFSAVDYGWWLS